MARFCPWREGRRVRPGLELPPVSRAQVTASAATPDAGQAGRQQAGLRGRLTPVNVVIAAMTLLALGLRLFYLTRPGYLLGVTEYDDGSYFGSAVRLVHGMLPYRDFVFVQPPGITLLMTPVALLARVTGTDWGLAVARIATMLVGAAGVALAGLLVRHRGVLAALIACGVVAIYPDSVASAHTLLVEPWLVLFCLAGAVAVFDGDRITGSSRRLIWGGVAFGFAGVIEAWAIIPVLVIVLLGLRWPRRMAFYAGRRGGRLRDPRAAVRRARAADVLQERDRRAGRRPGQRRPDAAVVPAAGDERLRQRPGRPAPVHPGRDRRNHRFRDRRLRTRLAAHQAAAARAGVVRLPDDRGRGGDLPVAGPVPLSLLRLPRALHRPVDCPAGGPAGGRGPVPCRGCGCGCRVPMPVPVPKDLRPDALAPRGQAPASCCPGAPSPWPWR